MGTDHDNKQGEMGKGVSSHVLVVCLMFLCMDAAMSAPPVVKSHGAKSRAKKLHASKPHHATPTSLKLKTTAAAHKATPQKTSRTHLVALEETDGEEGAAEEKETPSITPEQKDKMTKFLLFCLVAIIVFALIGMQTAKINNPDLTMGDYLGFNQKQMVPIAVFVGMASGIVFGFIDNLGLFMGMEYLDPLFKTLPNGDEEQVAAGYGNTFSDMIGAFLGTFAGSIVKDLSIKNAGYNDNDGYPIWAEAIGITIGCVIGVIIPRKILGPPKVDPNIAAIKNGVTQEQIEVVMKEFDRLDETSGKDGQVKLDLLKGSTIASVDKHIAEADVNGDGYVTRQEMLDRLNAANAAYKEATAAMFSNDEAIVESK